MWTVSGLHNDRFFRRQYQTYRIALRWYWYYVDRGDVADIYWSEES